jgi:cytochrome c biogenesis protein CcmG/thiol:disulfide interchange protein DsbE
MKHADIAQGATKRRRPGTFFAAAGLVLLLAMALSFVSAVHAQSTPKSLPDTLIPASQRKSAPGFTLLDAQGKSVSLEGYRGKVVLLDFWATWCGGCKVEIPWYIDFDRQYRDHGLAAVGASMDEDGWKSVRPFLARKKDPETGGDIAMPYPVVIATPAMAKQYNITSMPVTFLIDRQGRIALSHIGVVDRRSFENEIQELLKEPAGFSSLN